ncbi:MAG: hypothetical protein ACU0BS_03495 [Hasllibacter sp.]
MDTAPPTPAEGRPSAVELAATQADPAEADALTSYAATGIWQLAPRGLPAPPQGAGAPRAPAAGDGAVVAAAARGAGPAPQETAPLLRSLPPAGPGVTFDLDERGLVTATPEGALAPGGVTVFAAVPPRRPPERPPAPPAADAPAPDPRLAGARPRARPGPAAAASRDAAQDEAEPALAGADAIAPPEGRPDGADAAASAAPEDRPGAAEAVTAAAPRTGWVFGPGGIDAAPRARTRAAASPADAEAIDAAVTQAAVAAAEAAAGASLFRPPARPPGEAPEVEGEPEDIPGSSVYAVVRSMRPGDRPEGFAAATAEIRERTETLRSTAPVRTTPAAAAPTIPTSASVARTATQDNAIRLRNLNLIGVYGSASSPRALVRLPSGRYQRVQVGDRLDGGRVQAIQGDRLQYVKNGRAIVLEVPGA